MTSLAAVAVAAQVGLAEMTLQRLSPIGCCCDQVPPYGSGSSGSGSGYQAFGPCCCDRPSRILTVVRTAPDGQCETPLPCQADCSIVGTRSKPQWESSLLGKQIVMYKDEFRSGACTTNGNLTTQSTTWIGCRDIEILIDPCKGSPPPACPKCPLCTQVFVWRQRVTCVTSTDLTTNVTTVSWSIGIPCLVPSNRGTCVGVDIAGVPVDCSNAANFCGDTAIIFNNGDCNGVSGVVGSGTAPIQEVVVA